MIDGKENPRRSAVDVAVVLDGVPDDRIVNDGHHFMKMVGEEVEKEGGIAFLERRQVDVLGQIVGLALIGLVDPPRLLVDRGNRRGNEAVDAERTTFFLGESGSLVQEGVTDDLMAAGHDMVNALAGGRIDGEVLFHSGKSFVDWVERLWVSEDTRVSVGDCRCKIQLRRRS